MVSAFASQSLYLGLISQVKSYQETIPTYQMVFTAFVLVVQHKWDSVENKPARLLLVVALSKTLNGMPLSLFGRRMAEPSSLPVAVAQRN